MGLTKLTGADQFSSPVGVRGDDPFDVSVVGDSFVATVTLQRRTGTGFPWGDFKSYTVATEETITPGGAYDWRLGIKTGDYTSGAARVAVNNSANTALNNPEKPRVIPSSINIIGIGQSWIDQLVTSRDGGGSGGQTALQDTLATLTGASVTFHNASVGGSAMCSTADGGSGNFWNEGTDQPSALLISQMDTVMTALGDEDADVILYGAGGRESIAGTAQATYLDCAQKVIEYIRTRTGLTDLPVMMIPLGRRTDFAGSATAVRAAEVELEDDGRVWFSADNYDIPLIDTAHATDAGCVTVGERAARSIAVRLYGIAGIVPRGPRLVDATVLDNFTIKARIDNPDGGDAFTLGTDSFHVANPTSRVTLASLFQEGNSSVRLKTSTELDADEDVVISGFASRGEYLGSGDKSITQGDALPLRLAPSISRRVIGVGGDAPVTPPAGFDPTDLTSRLVHIDVSVASSVTASPLAITDLGSGYTGDLTVTGGTVGYSGTPESLLFNADSDRMAVANAAASTGQAAWATTGQGEIWMRIQRLESAAYVAQWMNQGTSLEGGIQIRTSNTTGGDEIQFTRFAGSAGSQVWETNATALPLSTWVTLHIVWSGASPDTAPVIRLDDVITGTTETDGLAGAAYTSPTTQIFKLGNNDNGNRGARGRIAFFMARNAVSTTQERSDMITYLGKWS